MNISIFASIGCQNLGDELILKDEIKIFNSIYFEKKPKFRVFTYDIKNLFFSQDNVDYLEYFPIGIRKKRNILRNICNFFSFLKTVIWSDLIVIGGGGIIYDNEVQSNKDPLDQWIFRKKIFKFFRKKVCFYAIGINIKNDKNKEKLKKIFSKNDDIYVRDSYSSGILKEIGIYSEVIDDPVFFDRDEKIEVLDGKAVKKYEFKNLLIKKIESSDFSLKDLETIDFSNKKVGIAFRSGYITKSGNKKIELLVFREFLNYLISQKAIIYLLPHSIHENDINSNDLIFYKNIISDSKYDKIILLNTIESVYEVYQNSLLDICLSMRLHSMILSQVYDIPFVAFSYSKKTAELIKKIK